MGVLRSFEASPIAGSSHTGLQAWPLETERPSQARLCRLPNSYAHGMTFLQRILCLHVLCVASCLVGGVRGGNAAPPPPQKNLILPGEVFEVAGRSAFVFTPASSLASESAKPWILYSPTLPAYPDKAEMWMHEQFVAGGVAVAGIDTGESYGSPEAVRAAEALHAEMVRRGYSKKPACCGLTLPRGPLVD